MGNHIPFLNPRIWGDPPPTTTVPEAAGLLFILALDPGPAPTTLIHRALFGRTESQGDPCG